MKKRTGEEVEILGHYIQVFSKVVVGRIEEHLVLSKKDGETNVFI
jgi:hypothetical protein